MRRNAEQYGSRPAMREKDRGIWQTFTWREYYDQVRDLALGLAALGFKRGDRLSVIGDNRPRLYWAQMAAMSLGGISVPVYQDSIAKELAYVWNHAEVSVIIAEDQEQVDKVLTLKAELPAVRLVVYDDPRGMLTYRHEWLKSYGDVQELGRERARQQPQLFEHEISAGRPDEVAIICYTSGTTGSPKGAMLTHANAISVAETFMAEEDVRPTDEYLAYLPMAWAGDATYTLFASLAAGFTVSCPESPETVQRDLRELGPSTLLAPPRIWENMLTGVLVRAGDASPLKRWIFERSRAVAERAELLRGAGIFKGYFRNEEATREVVDRDGWYRTGDAGFIDPRGHLVIIDRAKDVGALSEGTPFAPQFIENKLKFSPYIREAVAFGNDRAFVTAMIAIDLTTVGTWAERRGLAYTSYADLSQKAEIRGLVRDEIAKCNATLPDATKIRRFLLLTKDLDADDAEITRTRKVRRRFVAEKYAPVIDAFYSGRDEVAMSTSITYEDGRQGTIQSRVHLEDVAGAPAHA